MKAYQAHTSLTQRLDVRLVFLVGIGLAAFSVVAGLLTYRFAYRDQLSQAEALVQQFVQTVQVQAEVAAFVGNREIGHGVIEGLQTSPLIRAVRIESFDGFDLDLRTSSAAEFRQGRMYPLFSPMDRKQQIGWLTVLRNDKHIETSARDVALQQIAMMLVQVLAAAAILGIVLRIGLIDPIMRLAQAMAGVVPGSSERLTVSRRHAADEIGLLAQGANGILDAAEHAIGDLHEAKLSLERALAELEEKDQLKSKFFAAASHDLRQPIHAVRLFLEALKNTALDADQRKRVGSIEAAAQTLNELLESLLDISKLDAGVVVPQRDELAVSDLFARIDSNFSSLALQSGLRFKLYFPQAPLALHTDKRLLNIVLDNLIGNAFKNTPRGGILVALRIRKDACLIQVWDTGVGMEEAFLKRIYEEFFQIDNPEHDRKKGLGLGLAIAKRVTQLLGYTLSCRSRPGRGTVFELRIPLAELRESTAKRQCPQASGAHAELLRGKQLVVLEDDSAVARGIGEWLQSCGIEAIIFPSAEQALADTRTLLADGYIVDYQLAGVLSGLDFLEALQRTRPQTLNAVLVTGNTAARIVSAVARSRWTLLFKPVDPAQILAKLAPPSSSQG